MASPRIALLFAVFLTVNVVNADKKLPNLVELAKQLGLNKFVENLKATGVDRVLNHEGLFTVFAPTDEAFDRQIKYPHEAPLNETMMFHVARYQHLSKEFTNEMTVPSLLALRKVRINKYLTTDTANGRVIKSVDHMAHNGVIHVIDDVMSAVFHEAASIVTEVDLCCLDQHRLFMGLLKVAGVYQSLDDLGPFTFFVPTDRAFDKLHPDFIKHLEKNQTALQMLVLNHVVQNTYYTAGMHDGQKLNTMVDCELDVHVNNGGISVGKGKIVLPDMTATNGAIHSIDEILFPDHAQMNSVERFNIDPALIRLWNKMDKRYQSMNNIA